MKQSVVLACLLSLPPFAGAEKAAAPSLPSTTITLTPSIESSTSSTSPTSYKSAIFSTTTDTIDVSAFIASSSSISSPTNGPSTSVTPAAGFDSVDSSTASASASASTASSFSSNGSDEHRTLVIVLSSVLGFVGLLLIAAALFLAYRIGQGRTPFGHRAATPLDDDEIESWRGTVIEKKQQLSPDPTMLNRQGNSIQLMSSPGWTWTASPTSVRSAVSPSTTMPETPGFLAKAPNSRAGLTDETVPGADPFIPPVKRQSSRLSKAPPGHARSKSRRSSMSAKSVWSYNGGIGPTSDSKGEKIPMWFDPEDHAVRTELSRTDRTANSTPATSIFDGLSGGLSPRPKSQPRPWGRDTEIGRAIA